MNNLNCKMQAHAMGVQRNRLMLFVNHEVTTNVQISYPTHH